MKTPPLSVRALARIVILNAALSASAAHAASNVIWDPPSNISSDLDVVTDGTLAGAWALRNSNAGAQGTGLNAPFTINGVSFTGVTNSAGSGNIAVSLPTGGSFAKVGLTGPQQTAANASGTPYSQLSSSYKSLVVETFAVLQQGVNHPMEVTISGLSGNQTYTIQLWVNWSNNMGFHGSTRFTIGDSSSPLVDSNTTNLHGGLGQFITGSFTTGAGETSVTIVASTGNVSPAEGNAWVSINALQVRAVPKAAWFRNAKYGIRVGWPPYPPEVTGVANGTDGPYMSDFVKIKTGEDRSEWSKVVDNFNVPAFVDQVAETGAGYVIFPVGGSTGLFASPNSVYESTVRANSNPAHGPVLPGEFSSRRDLILELGTALNAKGIKLIVYAASEGPMRAYYVQRVNGTIVYPCLTTGAYDGVIGDNPNTPQNEAKYMAAWSNNFRTVWHGMINEWSTRWGSKVSGWWLDGCFSISGYRVSAMAENNDAPGNLTSLIAATKAGNPQSLVCANPSAEDFRALSESQDYTAGESGLYADGRAKLYSYPYQQFTSYGSNSQIQNHYYSYLGKDWLGTSRKYVDEEIINYISSVNSKGGVVSLSIGLTPTGQMSATSMDQMRRIKAALKPSMAPATPVKPPVKFANLALYKPAFFLRNNYNYGDPVIQPGVGYQKQPHAGVDGDSVTWAMSEVADAISYTIGYSYLVDLESVQNFDRVAVVFRDDRFSTQYLIEYSNTGLAGSWSLLNTTTGTYSNTTGGGLKIHDSDGTKSGRFLRITSKYPNWVTQSGTQMGIVEFAAYNVSGSVAPTPETVWVDEEVPVATSPSTGFSGTWYVANTMYEDLVSPVPATNRSVWEPIHGSGVPHPQHGVKLHWGTSNAGLNEHGFTTQGPLRIAASGDSLYCDVYLDPANPPTEVMLTWKDSAGSSEHRVFWGADSITAGTLGTNSRRYAGPLPATGKWARLSVPTSKVGLDGATLTGMTYSHYNGRVFFDRAGRTIESAYSGTTAPSSLTATPGNAQASLKWKPVFGASSYTVHASLTQGGPYALVAGGITATEYVDTSLLNGTTYYYVVTATIDGVPGPNSNEASVVPAP